MHAGAANTPALRCAVVCGHNFIIFQVVDG